MTLASEDEFRGHFERNRPMPPFGNLYQMNTFVDQRLEDEQIASAGSHTG